MIDIRVGSSVVKSPETAKSDAAYVRELLMDGRFQRLLGEYADVCTVNWSVGTTLDAREKAFMQLQGVKEFAKYLDVVVSRGTPARGAAGPQR